MVQWLRICQCKGHGFHPWLGEDKHAAEQLSPWATATEPQHPADRALQQEKNLQ